MPAAPFAKQMRPMKQALYDVFLRIWGSRFWRPYRWTHCFSPNVYPYPTAILSPTVPYSNTLACSSINSPVRHIYRGSTLPITINSAPFTHWSLEPHWMTWSVTMPWASSTHCPSTLQSEVHPSGHTLPSIGSSDPHDDTEYRCS